MQTTETAERNIGLDQFLSFMTMVISEVVDTPDRVYVGISQESSQNLFLKVAVKEKEVGQVVGKSGYLVRSLITIGQANLGKKGIEKRLHIDVSGN